MNWAEDEILNGMGAGTPLHKPPFELNEIHLLREFEGEELAMIASAVETKSYEKGGSIFKVAEPGDQLPSATWAVSATSVKVPSWLLR